MGTALLTTFREWLGFTPEVFVLFVVTMALTFGGAVVCFIMSAAFYRRTGPSGSYHMIERFEKSRILGMWFVLCGAVFLLVFASLSS